MTRAIRLGISTCPNDTFAFHGLLTRSVDWQGLDFQVELLDVTWNPESHILTLAATRPEGETGNLFVLAPKGLRVVNPQGNWIAKDANDHSLVIRRLFRFGREPVVWTLEFAPLGGSE